MVPLQGKAHALADTASPARIWSNRRGAECQMDRANAMSAHFEWVAEPAGKRT